MEAREGLLVLESRQSETSAWPEYRRVAAEFNNWAPTAREAFALGEGGKSVEEISAQLNATG